MQAFLQMSLHIRLQCNSKFMFCLVEIGGDFKRLPTKPSKMILRRNKTFTDLIQKPEVTRWLRTIYDVRNKCLKITK